MMKIAIIVTPEYQDVLSAKDIIDMLKLELNIKGGGNKYYAEGVWVENIKLDLHND